MLCELLLGPPEPDRACLCRLGCCLPLPPLPAGWPADWALPSLLLRGLPEVGPAPLSSHLRL